MNNQEIEYLDGGYPKDEHEDTDYNIDTLVETLVAMQNETHNPGYGNGTIKVMMDRKTWSSLNDNTKKYWDCIEPEEKEKFSTMPGIGTQILQTTRTMGTEWEDSTPQTTM